MIDELIARLEAGEDSYELWTDINDHMRGNGFSDQQWHANAFLINHAWDEPDCPEWMISIALSLVPRYARPVGNLAGFIHSATWQRCVGDIEDDKIACTIALAGLNAIKHERETPQE